MSFGNLDTIVFYGQDFSPLENAYIGYSKDDSGTMVYKSIKNDPYSIRLLQAFLDDVENETDKLIVGHSKDKADNDKDFSLYSPAKKEVVEGKDLGSEESSDENEEKQNYGSFGNLVGTIRKIYSNKDKNTCVHRIIKENSSDELKNGILKKINSARGAERQIIIKLEIFSRFDAFFDDTRKTPEQLNHYFFADMLLNDKLELNFDKEHHVDYDFDSLFDFYLLWLLLNSFRDALLKGYYKTYRRFERNDNKLKGSIDIARHIKMNLGMDNGRVAYSYRENTVDNMLNHLILAAFDYLKEKYPYIVDNNVDDEMLAELNHLKYEIGYPKYDRRTLISENAAPISHPYFSEYREIQENCLMILRDEGVSPFGNEDEHLDGILYYVPDLWEEYLVPPLNKALKNAALNKIKNKVLDEEYKLEMTAQEPIYVLTESKDEKTCLSLPDFVFWYKQRNLENDKIPFLILDAKYKTGWKKVLYNDFSMFSYLYEDYNKCIRDMESIEAASTGVVIPVKKEDLENDGSIRIARRFSSYNSIGCFYIFPVSVPSCKGSDSFYEWKKEFKEELDKLIERMTGIFAYECLQNIEIKKAFLKIRKKNKDFYNEVNIFEY